MNTLASGHVLRAADPTEKILHINDPRNPAFRFEWHPKAQEVFMVRIARKPEIGERIAHCIDTHARAIGAVHTFMRGYNERRLEPTLGDYKTAELIQRVPQQVRE